MANAGLPPILVLLLLIFPLTANAASLEVLKHPHHQRRSKGAVLSNVVNNLPLVGGNLLQKTPPVLPIIGIEQQQQQQQPLPIANPVVPQQPIPDTTTPVHEQQQPLPIANPVVPLQPIPAATPPVQQQQEQTLPTRLPSRINRTRKPKGVVGRAAGALSSSAWTPLPLPLPPVVTKGIPGAIGAAMNLPSFTGGKGSYPAMAQEFVDAHNKVRAEEGEPPLSWDPEIALFAEQYLNTRRYDCAMIHSGNPIYGESLFKGSGWDWHAADAVNEWAKEVSNFDRNTNTCIPGTMCGHYTAIVWKPTTHVGCARMECYAGGTLISCNYYPAGGPVNPFQH